MAKYLEVSTNLKPWKVSLEVMNFIAFFRLGIIITQLIYSVDFKEILIKHQAKN